MKDKNKQYIEYVHNKLPLKSGDRDTILQWIYDLNIIEWYIKHLTHKATDDLDTQDKIQEIYAFLCEVPQDKWDFLYMQGKRSIVAYVTGLVHRQVISTSSKCYKKYDRHNKREVLMDDVFWGGQDDEDE